MGDWAVDTIDDPANGNRQYLEDLIEQQATWSVLIVSTIHGHSHSRIRQGFERRNPSLLQQDWVQARAETSRVGLWCRVRVETSL